LCRLTEITVEVAVTGTTCVAVMPEVTRKVTEYERVWVAVLQQGTVISLSMPVVPSNRYAYKVAGVTVALRNDSQSSVPWREGNALPLMAVPRM